MDIELHSLISIGVDDGERISRKYAPLEVVTATPETKAFVDAFVEARLFTTDLAADGSAIVNIAHEALLQHWPRLQEWIEKNREDLRIRARINAAAGRWKNENRLREFLLSAGKQLSEAQELAKNKHIELTDTEKAFVHASIAKSKRIWWIKRAIAAVLVVLTIVASGTAYLAIKQRDRAETESKTAEQVSDFLVGLYKVLDPSEALGDTITAREILDKGARKIENELNDQPEVQATLMNTMGLVYQNLGLYEQANLLLEKALSIRRQIYGDEHPKVAESMGNLAGLMYDQNDYKAAEPLLRESLEMNRKLFGDEHIAVASCLNNLAFILSDRGEYAEAEDLLRESLAMYRKLLGNENQDVARSINDLGVLHKGRGNYSKAEVLYREALVIRQKIFGNEHPDVAESLYNLGVLNTYKGNYSKAEELYREALAIERKIYGDENRQVAQRIGYLADIQLAKKDYTSAEFLFLEAIEMERKALPITGVRMAIFKSGLGCCLIGLKRYEEAEMLLLENYSLLKAKRGMNYKYTINALNCIIELYEILGKSNKVSEYKALLPATTAVSETRN